MSRFSKLSKTERIQFWLDQLNQQASSGLTIKEFCDQQRISITAFYQWKRRLAPTVAGIHPQRSKPSSRNKAQSPGLQANRHRFTELIVSDSPLHSTASAACSGFNATATLPGGITIDFGSYPEVISLIVDRLVWQSQTIPSKSDQRMNVGEGIKTARKVKS